MQESAAEVLPGNASYYGYTTCEWSVRWWRWLLSIPKDNSPVFDTTGKNCGLCQEYTEVFFLCQTLGNSENEIFRKATIPKTKALFMPIINWISISGVDGVTIEELRTVAKNKIDVVTHLEFKVNGRSLSNLYKRRSTSNAFEIILPENNILDTLPGRKWCVSDGYWIFLKPVQNNLILSSFGSCSSGLNKIRVNYILATSGEITRSS